MASVVSGFGLIPTIGGASPRGEATDLYMIGPREGYTPYVGTLVSMMNNMRSRVLNSVKGLNQVQLDFLIDDKANSIGALLYHLAATDAYYHLHTFQGLKWNSWDESYKKKWAIAMDLGEPARKQIKGNDLNFYLHLLGETRENTLAEFKKRDDAWLLAEDKDPDFAKVNYFWEWFHVCEHESNHDGQIKLLAKRVPGAKPENE